MASSTALKRMILKPTKPTDIPILGIIFDMDGTLTKPQTYMFREMREALGILGKPVDIIDHMASLTDPTERELAELKVQQIEENTMLKMEPQHGLLEMLTFLKQQNVKFTICTRNLIKPVQHLSTNFLKGVEFHDPIVTRSFTPPKPSPLPLLHIAESWGLSPENLIMVGDSRDDMFGGLNAGCSMVLMKHKDNGHLVEEIPEIDGTIEDFYEFIELLNAGFDKKDKVKRDLKGGSGY